MSSAAIIGPSSLAGVLLVILVFLLLNPDKAQIWSSWVFGFFASAHQTLQRKVIAGRIQGTINQFFSGIEGEVPGLMPFRVKIQWAKDLDRDTLVAEDLVISKDGLRYQP